LLTATTPAGIGAGLTGTLRAADRFDEKERVQHPGTVRRHHSVTIAA
jgi:hypothetical protein